METQFVHKENLNGNRGFYVGQGFDVHQLVKDRKLILGGVEIEHEKGLMGHSDADVLIHAIIDAVIGAAGLGDIGKLFPDSNPKYKNVDSRIMLRMVMEKIFMNNLKINQIDSTIIAEKPKLRKYIDKMIENLKEDTRCTLVNVKATTTEKLGFIGNEEGIAAQAIVSLITI
jgi:2-C-methyl-D-erythritol 2,4-cyclodiphosphate synthase